MPRGLVVYHSDTGNTEKMARAIGEGIKDAGLDVEVKSVDNTSQDDLAAADAIVMGSPTYFSAMSGKMKAFIDESIKLWPGGPGPLKDKIGAVFTSCGGAEGGSVSTLLSIIEAMLWHGMIIVGHQSGYCGEVSLGTPDEDGIARCKEFGRRLAGFVKR